MDLFNLFSFLLMLFQFGIASRATSIPPDPSEKHNSSDENTERAVVYESLSVNTLENDMLEGIVVRKTLDNLTLSCTYRGPQEKPVSPDYITLQWHLPKELALTNRTKIWKSDGVLWLMISQLSMNDSGRYSCMDVEDGFLFGQAILIVRSSLAPAVPFCSSASMFLCWGQDLPSPSVLQGPHCILHSYTCDGRPDCPNGRDEHLETCLTDNPCQNKLMCGDGRCIPRDWCCNNGTLTRYGRYGYDCIPHPCCAQHFKPVEKLGGGWRKKPGAPPFLQMTLYTASFCVLIFVISIAFLISIICRARLKRSAEMGGAAVPGAQRPDPPGSLPTARCNYTLVPASTETPTSTYSAVLRRYFVSSVATTTPPSYSQAMADQDQEDAEPPSYFEIQQEGESGEPHSVQVRRPTDFGMGTLANVLFNTRYRPVPQEVLSFGELSDSDSSCRSPGSHTFNIYSSANAARPHTDSPLSRVGELLEPNRRSADGRIRRTTGLDRILDRFGLNAPYAVGRDVAQTRNEATATSPPPADEGHNPARRQFLSSLIERLRSSFYSNSPAPTIVSTRDPPSPTSPGNNVTSPTERRRPDTPDVLELSLNEIDLCRNVTGDTFTLNGRTIHLLGAGVEDRPEVYGVNLQSLYVVDGIIENLNTFVGRPVSPPPYSETADVAPPKIMGPPPPYKSRENLTLPSDQPGPSCSHSSQPDGQPVVVVGEAVPSTSAAATSLSERDMADQRDASMSSLQLAEPADNRDKDFVNGNVCKEESLNSLSAFDNGNSAMSSNYSLKQVMRDSGMDDNCNVTTPSCSGSGGVRRSAADLGGGSDALNNNPEGSRQLSLSTLTNGNPSPARCGAQLASGKPQTAQPSVFPPISLEFIDSDCVTE